MMAFGRKRAASPAPRPVRRALLLAACALMACLFAGAAFATGEAGNAVLAVSDIPAEASDQPAAAGGASLYDLLMAAGTAEEYEEILEGLSEEELLAAERSLSDAQLEALAGHYAALDPDSGVVEMSGVANTQAAPLLPAVQAVSKQRSAFGLARGIAIDDEPEADEPETGLVLDKTATYNENTKDYTITLESYVTGKVTTSTVEEAVPADIVLVLDSSGSMENEDGNNPWITIGTRDDVSALDTKYGASGVYQYNDKVLLFDHWRDMKYVDGKWYYAGWGDKLGQWLELGGSDNWAYGVDIRIKKMDALKIAAQQFTDQVASSSKGADGVSGTDDDVDHRIAIVGFATDAETKIGLTAVATGESSIKSAITGLKGSGATYADEGMARAKEILDTIPSARKSNRVVVMFTDGEPNHGSGFDTTVANSTIKTSGGIKASGATVYTVGVFDGSKLDTTVPMPDNASDLNKYMHYVSSNFKNAESMENGGKATYPKTGSYYLGATDATQLNEIFQSIAEEITTGGASVQLSSSAVVRDVVAPQFTAPANASDVKIYTAPYNGYDDEGERMFGDRVESDLNAEITANGSIQVTGFDFSSDENCVTDNVNKDTGKTTYSGKKLIIEFTVKSKDGFLGGNDVYTNSSAGVYENASATAPVREFPKPTVNVPIADITITATDKNVYLTQVPTDDQLKFGVTIKCGNVDITDPSKLEDWQKAYVDIESSFANSVGFDATADGTYTVTAKVSPKTGGSTTDQGTVATAKNGTETKNINVFKPELTYRDSEVWYGDTAPTDYSDNLTDTEWKHGETLSTAVAMIGTTAPKLDLTYAPETGKIVDEKIASKGDIAVGVTVKIGGTDVTNHTAFVHTKCDASDSDPADGEFWLHVRTCSLTVAKAAASGTTIGDGEYFVFNVEKDDEAYTQVVVKGTDSVTISGLPVGDYTVSEDSATAWRYSSSFGKDGSSATLSKGNSSATVTCTNMLENGNWLNHFARAVNVFGSNGPVIESNTSVSGRAS